MQRNASASEFRYEFCYPEYGPIAGCFEFSGWRNSGADGVRGVLVCAISSTRARPQRFLSLPLTYFRLIYISRFISTPNPCWLRGSTPVHGWSSCISYLLEICGMSMIGREVAHTRECVSQVVREYERESEGIWTAVPPPGP